MTNPDEDSLVTTLDGTQLDVTVDQDLQVVRLLIGESAVIDLTYVSALKFAEQIKTAVGAPPRGDISQL